MVILTLPAQGKRVVAQPAGATRASLGLGEVEASAQPAVLPAGRGLASHLPVLLRVFADPVEGAVLANHIVSDVHQNHLIVLVGGVLCYPVAVQHTQPTQATTCALLWDTPTNQQLVPKTLLRGAARGGCSHSWCRLLS